MENNVQNNEQYLENYRQDLIGRYAQGRRFYDEGWNARVKGQELDYSTGNIYSRDFLTGYNDCTDAMASGAPVQEI